MNGHMITATEATRHFSDLLNRVYYQKQSFDIKRGREIIAKLIPIKPVLLASEFENFLKNLPKLEKEDKEDFEKIIHAIRDDLHETRNLWG